MNPLRIVVAAISLCLSGWLDHALLEHANAVGIVRVARGQYVARTIGSQKRSAGAAYTLRTGPKSYLKKPSPVGEPSASASARNRSAADA